MFYINSVPYQLFLTGYWVVGMTYVASPNICCREEI